MEEHKFVTSLLTRSV